MKCPTDNTAFSGNEQFANDGSVALCVIAAQSTGSFASPTLQLPQHRHTSSSVSLHGVRNQQAGQTSSKHPLSPCFRCGKFGHLAILRNYPAKNKICQFCQIKGHFSAVCRKQQSSVQEVSHVQDAAPAVLSVNLMPTSPKDLRIFVVVGDHVNISFLVNTGATASLMTKDPDIYFASKHRVLQTSSQLQYFLEHCIPVLRYFRTDFQHSKKCTFVTYYFTAQGTSLLGLYAIQQLGLLIDGTTLTCRVTSPVSSEVPARVLSGFEHLLDGQLELVQDFAH
ncbi:hypothetical protein MRX96_005974 [Rhipicephalus microplus]